MVKPKSPKKTRPLNLRGFPDDLYWECKIRAAQQHKSVKDYVIAALQSAVSEDSNKSSRTA
jgi:plasmid stability protein